MNTRDYPDLRNCAIDIIIGMLGFSYFVVYLLLFLIFHFPSAQESIPSALVVIAFGGGIALWYLGVVIQNGRHVLRTEKTTKEGDSLRASSLFLIWTAALPTITFLFPAQPLLQLGYASAFTMIVIGSLPEGQLKEDTELLCGRFSLRFASVGLLALVPAIHALAQPLHDPSPLASAFGRLLLINFFGSAFYLFRPLERFRMGQSCKPSLRIMYLVLTYSLIEYSKVVLQVAIPYMS